MHVSPRSYLTAGIAALGAGALALAPIQPIPSQITAAPKAVVGDMAVNLAAAVDPIAAWVNVFETSAANIEILGKFNEQNPNPLLKTIGANWQTYLEELQNGQGNLIPEQIWNNIVTFFEAPWDPGSTVTLTNTSFPPPNNEAEVPAGPLGEVSYLSNTQPPVPAGNTNPSANPASPSDAQVLALQLIAGLSQTATPDDPETGPLWEIVASTIAPLLVFLNTPYSGQLLSWIGPLLAPVVSLTKSFTAVGEYFQEGKVQDAFYELINIPANMTNAVLNGAGFLNLAPLIGQFFDLPEILKDVQVGFNVGGLLNAMPQDGSLKVNPEDPQPARPTVWAGGTGFDSFAIPGCGPSGDPTVCGFISGQPVTGLTNGVFGAGIGLGQFLADKLLVTPPLEAPAAAKVAAPEAAAPALPEAPALTEAPAEESAPAVADEGAEESAPAVVDAAVAEDTTPVAEDNAPAADETLADLVSDDLDVDAPVEAAAVTEDAVPAPAAAVGSDDDGDSGSRASDSRRGARGTD